MNYKKRAALFLISQAITLFGSSVVQFAIIWYVTLRTSSGVWVALLTVASCIPQLLISFFSGVWADRASRKKMIIAADAAIAAATLALALLLPHVGEGETLLVALVVISVIRSLGAGVQTPAVNAAVSQLVPRDKLMKFNGLNSAVQSLVQFAALVLILSRTVFLKFTPRRRHGRPKRKHINPTAKGCHLRQPFAVGLIL